MGICPVEAGCLFAKSTLALAALVGALLLEGCAPISAPTPESTPAASVCEPTEPDMLGPFYVPGAPERDRVGEGYILSGRVRTTGCVALPGAVLEFWMAGPDGEYGDDFRAALAADAEGRYRFESPVPVPYAGRPPHIHLRVSAPGLETLVTQHYPQPGETEAVFDLTLRGE